MLSCLGVSLLFMVAGSSPIHAEQGVTDTEIHIGQSGPQSGPAAPWGIVSKGMATYFKLVNKRGGIHGRKIVFHDFDDGYNPAKTKAGVKRLQESIGMFCWMGISGGECGMAVKRYLENLQVPWVAPTDGSSFWTRPPSRYIFSAYPPFEHEGDVLVRYAVQHLGKKRIAIVYQDNHFRRSGLKGAQGAMAKLGLDFAAQVPVPKNQVDMKAFALSLKKSNAEAVILILTPFEACKLLRDAKKMNYTPQWMAFSAFSDFHYMHRISHGLWENMIAVSFYDFSTYPQWQDCRDEYKRTNDGDDANGVFFGSGVSWAMIAAEGLKRSGPDLTRENFIHAMEGLRNYKSLMPPISYYPFNPKDPKCREGQDKVILIKCLSGGRTQILTEPIKIDAEIVPLKETIVASF